MEFYCIILQFKLANLHLCVNIARWDIKREGNLFTYVFLLIAERFCPLQKVHQLGKRCEMSADSTTCFFITFELDHRLNNWRRNEPLESAEINEVKWWTSEMVLTGKSKKNAAYRSEPSVYILPARIISFNLVVFTFFSHGGVDVAQQTNRRC